MSSASPPPTFVGNLHAPELYASAVAGVAAEGGNLKITFSTSRTEYTNTSAVAQIVTCGRLVMPVESVKQMIDFLQQFISDPAGADNIRPAGQPLQ